MALDEQVLALLPPSHAILLRLRERGAADQLIAAALGVPIESLPALTLVAEAKLQRMLDGPDEVA